MNSVAVILIFSIFFMCIALQIGVSDTSATYLGNYLNKSEEWEDHPDFLKIEKEYAYYSVPASKSKVFGIPAAVVAQKVRKFLFPKSDGTFHYGVSQTTPEQARLAYMEEQNYNWSLSQLTTMGSMPTDQEIVDFLNKHHGHIKTPSLKKEAILSVRKVIQCGNEETMIRKMEVGIMGQTGSLSYAMLIGPGLFIREYGLIIFIVYIIIKRFIALNRWHENVPRISTH